MLAMPPGERHKHPQQSPECSSAGIGGERWTDGERGGQASATELSWRRSLEIYSENTGDCSFGFAESHLPKPSKSLLSPGHSPSGRREFVPSNKDSMNKGRSTRGLLGTVPGGQTPVLLG